MDSQIIDLFRKIWRDEMARFGNPETQMRRAFFFSIALFAQVSFGARADWQDTHWGQNFSAVMTALKGKAVAFSQEEITLYSPKGLTCKAHIPGYAMAGFTFSDARLCFDATDRLAAVRLYAEAEQFSGLERALDSNFGAPDGFSDAPYPTRMWNDRAKGNTIMLIKVTDTILDYRPIQGGF